MFRRYIETNLEGISYRRYVYVIKKEHSSRSSYTIVDRDGEHLS